MATSAAWAGGACLLLAGHAEHRLGPGGRPLRAAAAAPSSSCSCCCQPSSAPSCCCGSPLLLAAPPLGQAGAELGGDLALVAGGHGPVGALLPLAAAPALPARARPPRPPAPGSLAQLLHAFRLPLPGRLRGGRLRKRQLRGILPTAARRPRAAPAALPHGAAPQLPLSLSPSPSPTMALHLPRHWLRPSRPATPPRDITEPALSGPALLSSPWQRGLVSVRASTRRFVIAETYINFPI
ncbi:polyadenylate-binding protein-interacting protein 1-like [Hemicordylus capensis]|uniref:polyadenylate-binding protein-interacting protein 1-like n=1 Tax=Hemicordylus capensis TaxID=884348 RepID=UPI00230362D6|nr:polyadenylate-binding protein-interacting protein 1-like [Hemicordylus capensis]